LKTNIFDKRMTGFRAQVKYNKEQCIQMVPPVHEKRVILSALKHTCKHGYNGHGERNYY
jgi:hypothetical protein